MPPYQQPTFRYSLDQYDSNPILTASGPIFDSLLAIKRDQSPQQDAATLKAHFQKLIQQLQQYMQTLHCSAQIIASYTYLMYRLIDLTIQESPQLYSKIQPWQDDYFSQTQSDPQTRDRLYKVIFTATEQIQQQRVFLDACLLILNMIHNHHFAEQDQNIERLLRNLEKQLAPSDTYDSPSLPRVSRINNMYRYLKIRYHKYIYLIMIAILASIIYLASLWNQHGFLAAALKLFPAQTMQSSSYQMSHNTFASNHQSQPPQNLLQNSAGDNR